jgi:hypothetical protein
MLAIINAELVMKDHYFPEAYILLKDGKIFDYGKMSKIGDLTGYEVVDAEGAYVGPGLVDIHTHAADGHWFFEEPELAAKHMLEHGATTVLPTLYFNMKKEQLMEQIDTVRDALKGKKQTNFGGFYMETPYMNPKFGADRENNPWKGPICKDDYQPLLDKAGEDARVWVLAPEREGIEQFVIDAKAANPNVRFSVGHSEATPQQVEALKKYGLKLMPRPKLTAITCNATDRPDQESTAAQIITAELCGSFAASLTPPDISKKPKIRDRAMRGSPNFDKIETMQPESAEKKVTKAQACNVESDALCIAETKSVMGDTEGQKNALVLGRFANLDL